VPHDQPQESADRGISSHEIPSAERVRRRKSNRERMRRRRADPVHCAREQEKRKSKQSAADAGDPSSSASIAQPMGRVCAMCHPRAAVEEIFAARTFDIQSRRLRASTAALLRALLTAAG
jgi:hypothetical protein